jgi:hypothetical protein
MRASEPSSNEMTMLMSLLQRFAEFSPEFRVEPVTDWERVTREAWPPLCVGGRFFLVAPVG